jgi:hypothetical protein
MSATLTDVILQLQENNGTQEETNKGIKSLISGMTKPTRTSLDDLEKSRESSKSAGAQAGEKFAGMLMDPSKMLNKLMFFANPMNLLGPLLKGLAALSAAFLGFRGWELKAIEKLPGMISKFTSSIMDGIRAIFGNITKPIFAFTERITKPMTSMIDDLRTRIATLASTILRDYFGFGLIDEGGRFRDAETGKFAKKPVFHQVMSRVKGLTAQVRNIFGMAEDLPVAEADEGPGLFKKVLNTVKRIFEPIQKIFGFATDFFATTGKTIIQPVLKLGRLVFQKILWPIGVLFSAFEGVKAFMETEGTLIEKLGAGFGGFLGDFIGAPFDLLKSGINWLLSKLFGVEIKDGKYDESTMLGKILNTSEEFSIEKMISGLVKAPFKAIQTIIDWVKLLFNDPKKAFNNLVKGVFGEDGVVTTLLKPFVGIISAVVDTLSPIKDRVKQEFQLLALEVSQLPARITLAAKDMWVNVQEKLTVGFIELGAWFSSIPARVYAAALKTIRQSGRIGEYIVSEDDLKEAQANVKAKDTTLQSKIDVATTAANDKREELKRERIALDDQKQAAQAAIVAPNTTVADNSMKQTINNLNQAGIGTYDFDGALGGL